MLPDKVALGRGSIRPVGCGKRAGSPRDSCSEGHRSLWKVPDCGHLCVLQGTETWGMLLCSRSQSPGHPLWTPLPGISWGTSCTQSRYGDSCLLAASGPSHAVPSARDTLPRYPPDSILHHTAPLSPDPYLLALPLPPSSAVPKRSGRPTLLCPPLL